MYRKCNVLSAVRPLGCNPRSPSVVGRIPLLGALQTSSALHQMLRSLCDDVGKMDMRRGLNFATAAVEQDDFREVVEEVRSLAHCYRPRQGDEMDDSD